MLGDNAAMKKNKYMLANYWRKNIQQFLDEVEQNIVICQWRADQLFAEAEG